MKFTGSFNIFLKKSLNDPNPWWDAVMKIQDLNKNYIFISENTPCKMYLAFNHVWWNNLNFLVFHELFAFHCDKIPS